MPESATPAPDNSSINSTITAVAGLVQAIPVYQDALQPAAKEVGKSLELVAKVVSIALSPLKGVIWGYEKIEGFLNERVGEKLKDVPPENIVTPAANIVGPAIEALKFSGEDLILRELYANLIANAMDKETSLKTHPAFVEIIRTISSEEALILKYFAPGNIVEALIDVNLKYRDPAKTGSLPYASNISLIASHIGLLVDEKALQMPSYLNNLCRLGLLEIPYGISFVKTEKYDDLETSLNAYKINIEERIPERIVDYNHKVIQLTDFGRLFIDTVVKDK